MHEIKKHIYKWWQLYLILIIATTLRVSLLFIRGTFWFDEQFSVHFSTIASWPDTIKYWVLETNPPLFTFILKFYLPIVGKNNDLYIRILPLVFGILGIALLFLFAKKVFSKKIAILSSLMLAFSSLHIILSTETRVYSLLLLLTIGSCFIFYILFFEKKRDKIYWILYTIINTLLIYSHLTAVVIVFIQFLTIYLDKPSKKEIKKYIISFASSTIVWFLWFIPSIVSKFNITSASAWYFNDSEKKSGTILNLIILPFVNTLQNNIITTLMFIVLIVGSYFLIKKIKETKGVTKNTLIFILMWAFLPILFSSLLGVYVPKYVIISYPALFLLCAYIMDFYIKRYRIAVFIISIVMLPTATLTAITPIFSWHHFDNYINKNETENSIILMPFADVISYKKYKKSSSPYIGIYFRDDNLPLDERIVRYNWNKQNITEEELENWMFDKINKYNADKIFLIQQTELQDESHNFLFKNNWSLNSRQKSPGYFSYYLFEFNAPNN
jgi:uncharacterized membrane protein